MKTVDIITGMQMLTRYYDDANVEATASHVDLIAMLPTDHPVPGEILRRLVFLGWFQDVETSGDAFAPIDYNPSEPWCCRP